MLGAGKGSGESPCTKDLWDFIGWNGWKYTNKGPQPDNEQSHTIILPIIQTLVLLNACALRVASGLVLQPSYQIRPTC